MSFCLTYVWTFTNTMVAPIHETNHMAGCLLANSNHVVPGWILGAYGLLPWFGLVESMMKPNSSKITQYPTTAARMTLWATAASSVVPGQPHHVNIRREMPRLEKKAVRE